MTTPAPERERPWTLFAIALLGVLLGGGFGLAVNYLAGRQPGDMDGVLAAPNPLVAPQPEPHWMGRMARGLLGGLWWGGILSLVFTTRVGNVTGARCPLTLALPAFAIILLTALVGWPILGTGWGCFLGALVGLWLALHWLRGQWIRAQVVPIDDPNQPRPAPLWFRELTFEVVLRGLAVCALGTVLGFVLGGLAGLVAVGMCPEDFELVPAHGGFPARWRWPQDALYETARDCAWAGAFLGLLTAFVLAQVVNHARLLREARSKQPDETWQATQTAGTPGQYQTSDSTGIVAPREERYRQAPEREPE
jgi:hypothetical protein